MKISEEKCVGTTHSEPSASQSQARNQQMLSNSWVKAIAR
jgi:hypothetical protein